MIQAEKLLCRLKLAESFHQPKADEDYNNNERVVR